MDLWNEKFYLDLIFDKTKKNEDLRDCPQISKRNKQGIKRFVNLMS